MTSTRARTWTYDYPDACAVVDRLLELGDRVGLVWQGDFRPPLLAPAEERQARPAIVVAITGRVLEAALIEEGRP